MKTERMTLLVTPDDKAAISARASSLGLSVSELVRQAASNYDPNEATARAELVAFMPEFNAAVDDMHACFERMIATLQASEERRALMDTANYREEMREQLAVDRTIDWEAAYRAFSARHAA